MCAKQHMPLCAYCARTSISHTDAYRSLVGHIVRYILLLNGLKLIRIIIAVLLLFLVYFKVALEYFLLFDMISMSVATKGWAVCRETEKKKKS